ELNQELERLEAEADLRALVLTGRDPAFCSGANVKRMNEANEARGDTSVPEGVTPWDNLQQQWDTMASGESYMDGVRFLPLRLHNLQKPSIAAVNGYAMGLGMGIALSCDIRIASETARFSETFIRRGLIPADGSCWQLPRMIGLSNTFLLQYTGDAIEAREAYRLGMVSKVVPHSELMAATMELATRLANGPTYSMALTKKLIQESLFKNLEESLLLAGPAQNIARSTSDHKEGVRAFVEKRQPVYKGR
ncbi:MAG: enoyl-CoA hydratase/isomerase family protein, partial [Chloroflexi bacterium]|nr:enoyl-CoA hydratase/isomerase family protein [Chloroflexota bacterium]